jgi:hypothetical protein
VEGPKVNAQNPSKNEPYPTETINGVTVTNTTRKKGHGGRIISWKGPTPEESKAAPFENPESE